MHVPHDPIVFVINRIEELEAKQSTWTLVEAARRRGNDVIITDVMHFQVRGPQEVWVDGQLAPAVDKNDASPTALGIGFLRERNARVSIDLREARCVFVRTSPGRDGDHAWAHTLCLQALRLASEARVPVVNDPGGLTRASSKLYSACLPEQYTPKTLVTRSPVTTKDFVTTLDGPAILKPLVGSGGRDIFIIEGPDAPNLEQVATLLGREGYFLVQEYIPDAPKGDLRILLFDGKVLEIDGCQAVINRVPQAGQFRANVSLGARAQSAKLSPAQLEIANGVAKLILEDGIRLAGLDLVGNRVVEVNVFSTGGLNDADLFYDRPFTAHVLDELLAPSATQARP